MKKITFILMTLMITIGTWAAGNGTKENPYSVTEAIALNNNGSEVWVEGYIIGTRSNSNINALGSSISNFVLSIDDTNASTFEAKKHMTVDYNNLESIIEDDAAGHTGKKIKIQGTLTAYFSNSGIKSCKDYEYVAVEGFISAPIFSTPAGNFSEAFNLTLSCDTEGAEIYYTLDGTDPTATSTPYTVDGISIPAETTTVKAMSIKGDDASNIAEATYTYIAPLPAGAIIEDFASMENGTSYKDGSYNGVNGISWSYQGTAGTGKIVFGKGKSAYIESSSISGGCGTISFKYQQAFSTAANFKLYINDVEKGTFTTSDKSEQSSGEISINVAGDFTIKLTQTNSSAGQVNIDDIAWTPYEEGDVVTPSITFNDATVEFDEANGNTIDLSTLFTSSSTGAVTYAITAGNDDENAEITGTEFYAIAAGVYTVTATQAAVEGEYLEGTATATITITEPVAPTTIADFLAESVGDTFYQLEGEITGDINTTYGNFTLKDATGEVYVYGLTATKVDGNDKSFGTLGLAEGDVIVIIGKRNEHNGNPQVGGAYFIEKKDSEIGTGICAPTTIEGVSFDGRTIRNAKNAELHVFNAIGALVVSSTSDIDASALQGGMYIVRSAGATLKIMVK